KHRDELHAKKPHKRQKQDTAIFRTPIVVNVQTSSTTPEPKQNPDAKAEAVRRTRKFKPSN
ncbi:MAG: hypothetical protein KGK02_09540, partial [Rhodospirillales bacterium]|nr:hypothetical protein [Rhodospirillales bacterium]